MPFLLLASLFSNLARILQTVGHPGSTIWRDSAWSLKELARMNAIFSPFYFGCYLSSMAPNLAFGFIRCSFDAFSARLRVALQQCHCLFDSLAQVTTHRQLEAVVEIYFCLGMRSNHILPNSN